jgi:hypothetical protein
MLLISLLITITVRTLPGLNYKFNEVFLLPISTSTTKIETKLSYTVYTRIASVVLLLISLVSSQLLGLTQIGEGLSIFNGLFQITQVSLFLEIFISIIGALIVLA